MPKIPIHKSKEEISKRISLELFGSDLVGMTSGKVISTEFMIKVLKELSGQESETGSRRDALEKLVALVRDDKKEEAEYYDFTSLRSKNLLWQSIESVFFITEEDDEKKITSLSLLPKNTTLPNMHIDDADSFQPKINSKTVLLKVSEFIGQDAPTYGGMKLHIPQFQRAYVWQTGAVRDFVNSMIHNFPCGTLIWAKNGKQNRWEIIDGQQRIVTLRKLLNDDSYAKKFKINQSLKQTILDYQFVVSLLEPGEEQSDDDFWLNAISVFDRLNTKGKRLKSVDLRIATSHGKPLHTNLMKMSKTIREDLRCGAGNYAYQEFGHFLSKKQENSEDLVIPNDSNDEATIAIYDILSRRFVFGDYQNRYRRRSTNSTIREYFHKYGDMSDKDSNLKISNILEAVEVSAQILGAGNVGRAPEPPRILMNKIPIKHRERARRIRYSALLFTVFTIGIDASRFDDSDNVKQIILDKADSIKEEWARFYWTEINSQNHTSSFIWDIQDRWCNIVSLVVR